MRTAEIIRQKLTDALAPERLDIADDSHQHAGHAGHRPGGQTHFSVAVVSSAFEGKSRVERQRMVYALLKAELAGGVHALALTTQAPSEVKG
ncbi:MAG: BolA family protein [Alphaproteobacteria bacterium]